MDLQSAAESPSAPSARPGAADDLIRTLVAADTFEEALENLGRFLEQEPAAGYRRFYYETILRRAPGDQENPNDIIEDRIGAASAFFNSVEYTSTYIRRFLEYYSHLDRFLVVHVPKCGGTSIKHSIARTPEYAPLASGEDILNGHFGNRFRYVWNRLKRLSDPRVHSIFLEGHIFAAEIYKAGWKRPSDRVYCLIRHPVEIVVSYINFVLTTIYDRWDDSTTLRRRAALGVEDRRFSEREELVALVPAVIRYDILGEHPLTNPICRFVGRSPDFKAALDMVAALDIEFVHCHDVDKLMTAKGINSDGVQNASKTFVRTSDLSGTELQDVIEIVGEDLKLYEWYLADRRAKAG